MPTLREVVDQNVREGDLYEKLDRNRVRCFACGHCCPIPDGQPGVCKVRFNRGGVLLVPWGYTAECSAIRSRRSPSFMFHQEHLLTALECLAVTCIADIVRIG